MGETATNPKSTRKPKAAAETLPTIAAIKGIGLDMTCRGFKFEPGQTYTVAGKIKACGNGFHSCPFDEHPLSVFDYYAPGLSRYYEVEASGSTDREGNKIASASITIGVEISIGELVKRAWDYVWSRAEKSGDNHATGDQGAASATGTQGAAMSSGYEGRVSGVAGNALFAVERDGNYNIVSVAAGIVGRDGIEPGIWYQCRAGKLVEAA